MGSSLHFDVPTNGQVSVSRAARVDGRVDVRTGSSLKILRSLSSSFRINRGVGRFSNQLIILFLVTSFINIKAREYGLRVTAAENEIRREAKNIGLGDRGLGAIDVENESMDTTVYDRKKIDIKPFSIICWVIF